jgi:hypothetical protein
MAFKKTVDGAAFPSSLEDFIIQWLNNKNSKTSRLVLFGLGTVESSQ